MATQYLIMVYENRFSEAQMFSPEVRVFGLHACAGSICRQEALERVRFQHVAAVWSCADLTLEELPMRTPPGLGTQNVCCWGNQKQIWSVFFCTMDDRYYEIPEEEGYVKFNFEKTFFFVSLLTFSLTYWHFL
jgi:hypothetical protein